MSLIHVSLKHSVWDFLSLVENDAILVFIVKNPRNVLFLIWERVISKIRELVSEEEILRLYRRQLRLESCAINIYTIQLSH